MGRGHRPENEFSVRDHIRRDRQLRSAPEARPYWPEFRIIRQANTEPSFQTREWNELLNELGHRPGNHALGTAYALGSVAITLVSANNMRTMLEKKYPAAYSTPERTAKLHSRMRGEFKDFMRDAAKDAFNGQSAELEATHRLLARSMLVGGFSNELGDPFFEDEQVMEQELTARSPLALAELQLQPTGRLIYGAAEFTVTRLGCYGRGWGLDLSAHEQLYQERSGILRYLREDEQLDISAVEKDGWEAHATVFNLSGHIPSTQVTRELDLPPKILFDAVRSDC